MSCYEKWSIALTAMYDVLTFFLLLFIVYESIVKPKVPNVAFFMQTLPRDTKEWSRTVQLTDFIFENRGVELKNVVITSNPDYIGWDNLGPSAEKAGLVAKRTSEYFKKSFPYLGTNEKIQFFWCDMVANRDVLAKPFTVIVEYDNPVPVYRYFKSRSKTEFPFDFSAFDGVAWGATSKFDIHNVATELARVREQLETMKESLVKPPKV
ncbi:MAG: hypothetical protein K9N21_03985 [Deltaproteobacteria bacterium]|nr:hypothetical protein [Deltaproteobacteria bacterium]